MVDDHDLQLTPEQALRLRAEAGRQMRRHARVRAPQLRLQVRRGRHIAPVRAAAGRRVQRARIGPPGSPHSIYLPLPPASSNELLPPD